MNILDNINGKILHFEKVGTNWKESEIRSFGNAALSISSVDEWSDHIFINAESFTQPSALYYANESKDFKKIKSLPEKFAPEKYKVEQLYATSADGTQIPYFQISNSDMEKIL